jgi:cytochrome c-type biogenesis protein CcmH/NrfG
MAKLSLGQVVACLVCTAGLAVLGGCSRTNEVSLYADAAVLKEMNQNDQAVAKLQQAVKKNPDFAMAYSLLGDIYKESKEYEKSAKAYSKATQLNPFSFSDFFSLGSVYKEMQRWSDAVMAYVKASELKPENVEAKVETATCYNQLKDYDKAEVYAVAAKALSPDDVEVQRVLGDVYQGKQDYEQAISAYRRALEIEGNKPEIMVPLAKAYLMTGRADAGKELLMQAVKLQPENGKAYQYLGYADLQLGDYDGSIDSYRTALTLDEKDWTSHTGLGVAYATKGLRTGDKEMKIRALEEWKTSLEINPSQPKLVRVLKKYEGSK